MPIPPPASDHPERPERAGEDPDAYHSDSGEGPGVGGPDGEGPGEGAGVAAPGSAAAVAQGCRCPTLANEPRAGAPDTPLLAPDCPVHPPPAGASGR